MSATKQDYKAVAAAIRSERVKADKAGWSHPTEARAWATACLAVSMNIADHFARNPKFSREEFLRDCGVQS